MRNLSDEQITAIIKNGGVIGMNSVSQLTAPAKDNAGVSDMVNHVDHIAELGGIDHVGLGFDICHSIGNYLQLDSPLPAYDIIAHHGKLAEFTEALICRGYTDDQVIAILGGNFKTGIQADSGRMKARGTHSANYIPMVNPDDFSGVFR